MKDIKDAHPIEKKAHTKIGKFLKKITKIEVMAVVIAALQLVIAFPQLKIAYDSLINDDTRNLKNAFSDFVHHTDNIAIIHIPDSLMTPEIASIRVKQNELFFYLKLLSHTDFSFDINSNNHRVIKASITSTILQMQQIVHCCQGINKIESDLYQSYFSNKGKNITTPLPDSLLTTPQRILTLYVSVKQLEDIVQIQTDINTSLNRCLIKMDNTRDNNIDNIKTFLIKNMPLKQYSEYLRMQNELGISFINALNQIQYALAYNIKIPS